MSTDTTPKITDEMVAAAQVVIERGHSYLSSRALAEDVLGAALAGLLIRDRRSYIEDESHPRNRWGVARCAYAAAHDIEPHEVDTTDGSYADMSMVITEDYWEMLEVLAKAAGLPEDADFADILEWINARKAGPGVVG